MKYTSKDVSVVIPAYNCSGNILNAIKSVFEQKEFRGEVIIVNDGSTDSTQETILTSEFASKIKYYCIENSGPGAARNYGIKKASGEWIAFLDSDDLWTSKSKINKQLEVVNNHDNVVLVDTFAVATWGPKEVPKNRVKTGSVANDLHFENTINATSSVLARKSAIESAGYFPEDIRFGEDRLLWLSLAYSGSVRTVNSVAVKKINSEGNLTSYSDKNFLERIAFIKRLFTLIRNNEFQSENYYSKVGFYNMKDFFRVSMKKNNTHLFQLVYEESKVYSRRRLFMSKYFYFNLYLRIFGTFWPFYKFKMK